jgi:hypothetical protein
MCGSYLRGVITVTVVASAEHGDRVDAPHFQRAHEIAGVKIGADVGNVGRRVKIQVPGTEVEVPGTLDAALAGWTWCDLRPNAANDQSSRARLGRPTAVNVSMVLK